MQNFFSTLVVAGHILYFDYTQDSMDLLVCCDGVLDSWVKFLAGNIRGQWGSVNFRKPSVDNFDWN